MVDTESQEEVWSERYEKDLDDVFSIQSDIAARVAESLKVRLVGAEKERMQSKKETESVAAYIAYLKGRSLLREGTEKSVRLAKEQFELAIKEDHSYAKAYAGMADTMVLLGDLLFSPVPKALGEANEYVNKALSLEPDLAEARVSLGTLLLSDYRFDDAERELRKAVETNPSYPTGHQYYSICLQCFGYHEQAIQQSLIAEELDPLSPSVALMSFYRLIHAGRFDEARRRMRKLAEIDRESPLADEALMVYHFVKKEWDAALVPLRKMIERDPTDPYLDMTLACIFAATGKRDEALTLVEKLKKIPEDQRARGGTLGVRLHSARRLRLGPRMDCLRLFKEGVHRILDKRRHGIRPPEERQEVPGAPKVHRPSSRPVAGLADVHQYQEAQGHPEEAPKRRGSSTTTPRPVLADVLPILDTDYPGSTFLRQIPKRTCRVMCATPIKNGQSLLRD